MAESEHNDTITIREIEYAISITDKEGRGHDLCDLLRHELTRFGDRHNISGSSENPIRDFLKTNIEQSLEFKDNTKVYLLNYTEQGSLNLVFAILVITDSNYRDSLQSIDYFIKNTIGGYFEEILERHLPVSISIHVSGKNFVFNTKNRPSKTSSLAQSHRDYLAIILSALAILITLGIGLISMFQSKPENEFKKPMIEYPNEDLDSILEKKVKQLLEKKGITDKVPESIGPDSTLNDKYIKK